MLFECISAVGLLRPLDSYLKPFLTYYFEDDDDDDEDDDDEPLQQQDDFSDNDF